MGREVLKIGVPGSEPADALWSQAKLEHRPASRVKKFSSQSLNGDRQHNNISLAIVALMDKSTSKQLCGIFENDGLPSIHGREHQRCMKWEMVRTREKQPKQRPSGEE